MVKPKNKRRKKESIKSKLGNGTKRWNSPKEQLERYLTKKEMENHG
jgi:hypothetical protein